MKKHTIGLIATAAVFPIISISIIAATGSAAKNNKWKSAKEVFPIFGKFEHGGNNPTHERKAFTTDSVIVKNSQIHDGRVNIGAISKANVLLDLSQGKAAQSASGKVVILDSVHVECQILSNLSKLEFINSYASLHPNLNQVRANATIKLKNSELHFDELDEKQVVKIQKRNVGQLTIELSDTSKSNLTDLLKLHEVSLNIYLRSGSTLEFSSDLPKSSSSRVKIWYESGCFLSIPTHLLPNCQLISN